MLRIFTTVVIIILSVLVVGLFVRSILTSRSKEISVYKQPVPQNMQPPKNKFKRIVPYDLQHVVDNDWNVKFDAFAPFFYWEPTNDKDLTLVKYIAADNIIKYGDIVVPKDPSIVDKDSQAKYKRAFTSNTGKYVVLLPETFNPDIVYIKNLDTSETAQYTMTRNRPMNATSFNDGLWSPNDTYLYYMFYNEDGAETELWAIDTRTKTNRKLYSSLYPIHVYGWKNAQTIMFHDRNVPEDTSIVLKTLSLSTGVVSIVGSCTEPWLSECYNTRFVNTAKDVIYLDRNNQSGIYAYNFTNQLVKPLFEVGAGDEGTRSTIFNMSPRGKYMYVNLFSRSGTPNLKTGLYVISVENDFWRHLAENSNIHVEMYDYNEFVSLLKSFPDNSYYIHETSGPLFEKANVPSNMTDFATINVFAN